LGCHAYEPPCRWDDIGYCQLQHAVEKIEEDTGFYGPGRTLTNCKAKPAEPCEKPRTAKKFCEIWLQKHEERKRVNEEK